MLLAIALALWPTPAAAAPPVATGIRVGDHPAFVRVVVDFRGRLPTPTEDLEATDPDPYADGRAVLRMAGRTATGPVSAQGVRVTVARGASGRITIRAQGARRRFKYASYTTLHSPERVVLDLFKSAPPVAAAEIRRAPSGCLRLTSVAVSGRTVTASGRERDLFEHSFVLQVRGAGGRVLASRPQTGDPWRDRLRVPAGTPAQAGTLEAAAFSARDGALVCLVQVRVRL